MITLYYHKKRLQRTDSFRVLKKIVRDRKTVFWLDVSGGDAREIRHVLADIMKFHSLAVEDCLSFTAHPRIDDYSNTTFILLHSLNFYKNESRVSTRELDAFLGKNFLVTYHYKPLECVKQLEKKIVSDKKALTRGPDRIYHFLLDNMFDGYFSVLEGLDEKIQHIEESMLRKSRGHFREVLGEITAFRKNILIIRKIIIPQIRVMKDLIGEHNRFIRESNRVYFRDILEHLNRISHMVDVNLDLIQGTFDSFSFLLSHRTNETMRVLTIIATIMMPLTFIAGVYGMNFKFMPELSWKYGYFAVLGIMAGLSAFMLWFFKRKKWL